MEVVRWLHRDRFNADKNRFTRVAFRNSANNGGLSVSECQCIYSLGYSSGADICEHANACYLSKGAKTVSDPPIYWKFDVSILPSSRVVTPMPTNDDPCHYNITNVDDDALNDIFKARNLPDFLICDEGGPRSLRIEDLITKPSV